MSVCVWVCVLFQPQSDSRRVSLSVLFSVAHKDVCVCARARARACMVCVYVCVCASVCMCV